MDRARTTRAEPQGLLDDLEQELDRAIRQFRAYMASPEGRALRRRAAQVLIIGAPLLFRMKLIRRHPVGRLLAVAGGAALVVKLAEALRDWEPVQDLAEDFGLRD